MKKFFSILAGTVIASVVFGPRHARHGAAIAKKLHEHFTGEHSDGEPFDPATLHDITKRD